MGRRSEPPSAHSARSPPHCSNDMEAVIREAGRRLQRPDADVDPYIEIIVKNNWITSREAAMTMTRDQWRELQIPALLLNEIFILLNNDPDVNEPTPEMLRVADAPAPNTEASSDHVAEPLLRLMDSQASDSHPTSDDYLTEVMLAVPEWHPLVSRSLTSAHDRLLRCEGFEYPHDNQSDCRPETEASPSLRETLLLLLKILDNIFADPNNKKKRRIRFENPKFGKIIGRNPAAVDFLHSVGFVSVGDFLDLPIAFLSRITDGRQLLAESLRLRFNVVSPPLHNVISNSCFNPFQSNITYNTTVIDAQVLRREHTKAVRESFELDNKIAILQHQLQDSKAVAAEVAPNPKIFRIEGGRLAVSSMNSLLRRTVKATGLQSENERCERYASNIPSLTAEDLARIKRNISDGPAFASRRLLEYKALQNRPQFSTTILRIQFPDDYVLELCFNSAETVEQVQTTILNFLHGSIRGKPFYLYQTPPVRRLDPKKTLYHESLPPRSVVRFGSEEARELEASRAKGDLEPPPSQEEEMAKKLEGEPEDATSQYLDPTVVAKYWTQLSPPTSATTVPAPDETRMEKASSKTQSSNGYTENRE